MLNYVTSSVRVDAWQGLVGFIPTEVKVRHLDALLGAGFRTLDMGSFVSPKAVPQLADTEAVLPRAAALRSGQPLGHYRQRARADAGD